MNTIKTFIKTPIGVALIVAAVCILGSVTSAIPDNVTTTTEVALYDLY